MTIQDKFRHGLPWASHAVKRCACKEATRNSFLNQPHRQDDQVKHFFKLSVQHSMTPDIQDKQYAIEASYSAMVAVLSKASHDKAELSLS